MSVLPVRFDKIDSRAKSLEQEEEKEEESPVTSVMVEMERIPEDVLMRRR